jgi:hypothetical protein
MADTIVPVSQVYYHQDKAQRMATANTQAVKFVKQRAEQRFTFWATKISVNINEVAFDIKKSHWWEFRKRKKLKLELFSLGITFATIKQVINEIRLLN